MRILIAEDEVSIAKALKVMLEKQNYTVDMVHNGNDALDFIHESSYDVLILDIMMPGMDGISVLKEARGFGIKTPALFLTAKSEIEDRVEGLDAGADDYLPKPFSTAEFLARVRALTRRSGTYTPERISVGDTVLDCKQYCLSFKDSVTRLSNKEFQLMESFMRYPKQIFSTERLMETAWDWDSNASIEVVRTYIGFLRRKLEEIEADIEIKTVRGVGYTLELKK